MADTAEVIAAVKVEVIAVDTVAATAAVATSAVEPTVTVVVAASTAADTASAAAVGDTSPAAAVVPMAAAAVVAKRRTETDQLKLKDGCLGSRSCLTNVEMLDSEVIIQSAEKLGWSLKPLARMSATPMFS